MFRLWLNQGVRPIPLKPVSYSLKRDADSPETTGNSEDEKEDTAPEEKLSTLT